MRLAWLRFLVLILAALTLSLEFTHVLELPQKMGYDPKLYSAVNTSLYLYFALVGGPLTVLTLMSGIALAVLTRRESEFRWTLAGVLAYCTAFVIWLSVVSPVNERIAVAMARAPDTLPQLWMGLKARWEYGHATGFVLEFAGLACLLWSVSGARARPSGAP